MATYSSFEEIDHWLSENGYFEEGLILHAERNPLSITVGYTSYGNYNAYSERHIRSFKIIPSDILEGTSFSEKTFSEDYYIEAIDPLNIQNGVGIEILDHWPPFKLIAKSFSIVEQELIKTTVKPWLSDSSIFVKVPL